MTLIVCPLHEVEQVCTDRTPSHVLSLLGEAANPPPMAHLTEMRRLRLLFNDIIEPKEGFIHPAEEHIRAILEFGAAWKPPQPMVIHCWAGISRSTAAAYILACERMGPGSEGLLAKRLREASPTATPNPLMIEIADELLGRDGAMKGAIGWIGRGEVAEAGKAFTLDLD